jgi:hypothetical protein
MGGDLTAQSEGLGKGTTLTFTIPLSVPSPEDGVPRVSSVRICRVSGFAAASAGGALQAPHAGSCAGAAAASNSDAHVHANERSATPTAALVAAATPPAVVAPPLEPFMPPSDAPPAPPATVSAASAANILPLPSAAHILVAEDDPLSQAVMRKVLSRLGLRHTLVGDGAAAVEAYRRGAQLLLSACVAPPLTLSLLTLADTYDLVLMDLHMYALMPA